MMMAMTGLLGQGFGGQPTAFGPNFPQVIGANVPRPLTAPAPSTTQFPGCSDIQSVGSPILLNFQAQKIIEEAMKLQTQGSFVRFIYFNAADATPDANNITPFSKFYKLVFEFRNQAGPNYVGIFFDNPTNGIGTVKFLKFILNPNLDVIRKVLKITDNFNINGFKCGDLKMIFSSFGNDPRNSLNGQFPGQNRNGLNPALLQALKALAQRTTSNTADAYTRDCSASRFFKPSNYWANTDTNQNFPANLAGSGIVSNPDYTVREFALCNVEGKRAVSRLTLACISAGAGAAATGFMSTAKATLITPFTSALTETEKVGTGTEQTVFDIDLSAPAERIELYFSDGNTTPKWWAIQVFDSSSAVLGSYKCAAPATLPAYKQRVAVTDLLGFWAAIKKTSTTNNTPLPATNLGAFGFIVYQ